MERINNIQFSGLTSYQKYRFDYYRKLSFLSTLFITVIGIFLWLGGYAMDYSGIGVFIWGAVLILVMALPYLVALRCECGYSITFLCAAITILGWEVGFVIIITHLSLSMEYALIGFIFFIMMPLVMTIGFSLATNANMIAMIVGLPIVYVSLGFTRQFDILQYIIFILPLSLISIFAHYIFIRLHTIHWE